MASPRPEPLVLLRADSRRVKGALTRLASSPGCRGRGRDVDGRPRIAGPADLQLGARGRRSDGVFDEVGEGPRRPGAARGQGRAPVAHRDGRSPAGRRGWPACRPGAGEVEGFDLLAAVFFENSRNWLMMRSMSSMSETIASTSAGSAPHIRRPGAGGRGVRVDRGRRRPGSAPGRRRAAAGRGPSGEGVGQVGDPRPGPLAEAGGTAPPDGGAAIAMALRGG